MMQIKKLDRRHTGFERFSHRVEFFGRGEEQRQWIKTRNWLWQQFGPSAELHLARDAYFGEQPKWAWDTDKSAIYLVDQAYTMFVLKWEAWQNEKL